MAASSSTNNPRGSSSWFNADPRPFPPATVTPFSFHVALAQMPSSGIAGVVGLARRCRDKHERSDVLTPYLWSSLKLLVDRQFVRKVSLDSIGEHLDNVGVSHIDNSVESIGYSHMKSAPNIWNKARHICHHAQELSAEGSHIQDWMSIDGMEWHRNMPGPRLDLVN